MSSNLRRPSSGRTSLGAGRTSFGAGRPSVGAGRSSFGHGRPSLGGSSGQNAKGYAAAGRDRWNSTNRFSLTSEGQSRVLAKDPRQTQDKATVKENLALLSQFLLERRFPGAPSMKELRQPSSQLVLTIFRFLLSFKLPKVQISKMEDLLAIFPLLGYPFKINKSMLMAVGSPHAWPAVLGSMVFIISGFEPDEGGVWHEAFLSDDADPEDFSGEEPQMICRMAYHEKCYSEFMDNSQSDVAEQEFDLLCNASRAQLRQEHQVLGQRCEAAASEYKMLTSQMSPLEHMESEYGQVSQDIPKMENYIVQLEGHCRLMEDKQTLLAQQLAQCDQLAAQVTEMFEQVEAEVAAYPLSPEDIQHIRREYEALCNEKRALNAQLEEAKCTKYDGEIKVNRRKPPIMKRLDGYHKSIEALGLTSKPLSMGQVFRLDLDRMPTARPSFTAVHDVLVDQLENSKKKHFQHLNEDYELQQAEDKQISRSNDLEAELKLAREQYKHKLHLETENYASERSRREERIKKRHNLLRTQGEHWQQQISDKQHQVVVLQESINEEKAQMSVELSKQEAFNQLAVQKVANHLDNLEHMYSELTQRVTRIAETVKKKKQPKPSEAWW